LAQKARQGQLIWRRGGWSGRYRTIVDGEQVRLCVPLGTTNKAVARVKLERLVAGTATPDTVVQAETFEDAARRIVPGQGVKTSDERLRRLETYAFPKLGHRLVTGLRGADIREVLDDAAAQGLSKTTVGHILDDISGVLDSLWRYEVIPENPAKRVEVPKTAKVDDRPRVVLTDDEFSRFIAWPDLDPELRLMALTARCFGGMRTSDLHAWDWSHIDVHGWVHAHVPRPKTKTRDRLGLPRLIVPTLRAWWLAAGSPTDGPVFPETNRERAGERRGKRSHARRLRAALWSAEVRRGATKETCELQTDTPDTKRVDFHSFRRAFNTALAGAGVNVQLAMKLAGHRNPSTHMRYVLLAESVPMPDAALPRFDLGTVGAQGREVLTAKSLRPQRDLNPCYRRERPMS
jgi:integrase